MEILIQYTKSNHEIKVSSRATCNQHSLPLPPLLPPSQEFVRNSDTYVRIFVDLPSLSPRALNARKIDAIVARIDIARVSARVILSGGEVFHRGRM